MPSYMNKLTDQQLFIMGQLHLYRGLLYSQLIEHLAYKKTGNPATASYIKNTYKDIQKLAYLRLISREPVKLGRTKDILSLSEAGLEYVNEHVGILPSHIGTGWGYDFGDFPYELQRPPKPSSPVIHHHLMLADVLLKIDKIKDDFPQLNIDFRDNRYNSTKFEINGTTHRFKPDGDLRVNKQRIIIEVDRGTEFGDKLREKFQTYKYYLQHLESNGEELPIAVLFVCNKESNNGMQRRWSLISNAFWEEMEEWRTRFNLIGINSTLDLEKVLISQGERKLWFNNIHQKLLSYRTELTKINLLSTEHGLDWCDPLFSLSKSQSGSKLYVFEHVEQFETIGLARLFEWYRWHHATKAKYSDMKQVKQFIPVLIQSDGEPFKLIFKGLAQKDILEQIFSPKLWLNVDKELEWRATDGSLIEVKNPLED